MLGDGDPGGPRLIYVEEPEPRGTAGAIRFAEQHLHDRFLALNGDVLTDLDLTALMRHHEQAGALATLGLYPVDDPTAYGLVRHRPDGGITEFLEKPDPAEIDTDEVNAGTYVLEREVLAEIAPDANVSIERDVFPRLVGRGLHGIRLDGYWMDIGTPERYLQASWDILEGRVETDVQPTAPGVFAHPEAEVHPEATVGPARVRRGLPGRRGRGDRGLGAPRRLRGGGGRHGPRVDPRRAGRGRCAGEGGGHGARQGRKG